MELASLLLLLQAGAVERLESEDVEIREAAKLELLNRGAKALPALRASGTFEARGVIERVYAEAERAYRMSIARPQEYCGETNFLEPAQSLRWTRELEPLFPGCRLRAALTSCRHRNLCDLEGLWIYALDEKDAEVFTIRRGRRIGDGFLRRMPAVPGREEETARLLQGGWSSDQLIFDHCGLPIRVQRTCR